MTQLTHWKQYQEDNAIGAWIFESKKDIVVTIKEVKYEDFVGSDGKKGKKRICHLKEYEKPMVLNSTNSATIEKIYETPFVEDWEGKKIQLYKTTIRAFGENKDAIRIRKWNPETCSECQKKIEAFQNMTAEQLAVYTTTKYNHPLCSECAQKMAGNK